MFSRLSQDALTRALGKKFSWRQYLQFFLRAVDLNNGYLVVDETDVDKSYAKILDNLSWIFSHRKNKYILGYHLVVVVWTNGSLTFPVGWKVYQAGKKETKIDLALKLFEYCLYTLQIQPKGFLFDSFYANDKIMKHLDSRGFKFLLPVQEKPCTEWYAGTYQETILLD